MGLHLRRTALLLIALSAIPLHAGTKWTDPSPDELKMTSDPSAPGAAAVYLYLEQTADDGKHERTWYARIKILTEEGRKYADVTMPFWAREEWIRGVEGRTIHSDGTIVPFTGKPWQKELVRSGGARIMEKGFSMPDVQIGSILEYRYTTNYDDWWPPRWYLQQPIFVHAAHYHFTPGPGGTVLATRFLPPNAQVDEKKGWDLRVASLPAALDEDDSPPASILGYRVLFYYMDRAVTSPDQFWTSAGAYWSQGVDLYAAPDQLKPAVAQIISPSDSDEQKLRKIYAAVMRLENTSFTRQHAAEEINQQKRKITTAADAWQQRSGNRQQIALLFIGMARAAGLTAFAMRVTDRDENAFSRNETDWDQLDDTIAIVVLNGKEVYFDPGDPFCEFGKLHWKHTWTQGVRQTPNHTTEIASTPYPSAADTTIQRSADLRVDAGGQMHGVIRIVMTGSAALFWRQEAFQTDEEATKKEFTDELASALPPGLTLHISSLAPLDNPDLPLTAALDVSGSLGTRTGRRIFLPAAFFEAQQKPRFSSPTRETAVYLHYGYTAEDKVRITLPEQSSPEVLPKDTALSLASSADFSATCRAANNVYECDRRQKIARILFPVKDYPDLRDFFQKMNLQDQSPLVVTTVPPQSSGGQ